MNWRPSRYGYYVSDTGLVRNSYGRFMIQHKHHKGYMEVRLCVGYIKTNHKVHRLVACAFIPNPNKLPEINHKDCDKTNNNVNNLEWCTRIQNMAHAKANGLRPKGVEIPWAKLDSSKVKKIRFLYAKGNWTHRELGKIFKVHHSVIGRMLNGITWKHI